MDIRSTAERTIGTENSKATALQTKKRKRKRKKKPNQDRNFDIQLPSNLAKYKKDCIL